MISICNMYITADLFFTKNKKFIQTGELIYSNDPDYFLNAFQLRNKDRDLIFLTIDDSDSYKTSSKFVLKDKILLSFLKNIENNCKYELEFLHTH